MKIFLLRHGETNSNVRKIIQGTIDTSLNETGHHQAQLLGERLASTEAHHIFCSDLKRCRETLQHVLDQQSRPCEVVYTASLQERYMAELQGIEKEVVERMCQEQNKTKYDFGEGTKALTARVEKFWETDVLPIYKTGINGTNGNIQHAEDVEASQETRNIFICSHGGTLLQLTNSLIKTFHFSLAEGQAITRASPNTGVTILDTDTMTIDQYANVDHLKKLGKDELKREEKMEVVDV